jgi:hypothetical protein
MMETLSPANPRIASVPLPMGKKAVFTFLNMTVGSTTGNKQHRLVVTPSAGTAKAGILLSPPNLNPPAPTISMGPYNLPVILTLCGSSAPELVPNPTWAASWTKVDTVVAAAQYVISLDDVDQNGAYENLIVALVFV